MSFTNTCRLCRRLIISQAVTFAADTVTINLPAGGYNNGERYCIVIAQSIPAAATINAPVVITIGDGATEYPLTNKCCAQLTAAALRTRTKYATVVSTNATGGSFKLLGRAACAPDNALQSLDGGAAAGGGDGA